jgi:hypothetical protein
MVASMEAPWHMLATAVPNRGQYGAKPCTTSVGGGEHMGVSKRCRLTEFVDELVGVWHGRACARSVEEGKTISTRMEVSVVARCVERDHW